MDNAAENKQVKSGSNKSEPYDEGAITAMVIDEVITLIDLIKAGQIDARANAGDARGMDKILLEGVNEMLDVVIKPLMIASDYVTSIAQGIIPQAIEGNYRGIFSDIKNNLNACIQGMGGLIECNTVLNRLAINDHTVKVEGQYQGIYADTARAVNEVRDRLLSIADMNNRIAVGDLSELDMLRKVGKRSEQDQMIPSYISMIENIKGMVDEAQALTSAAMQGQLSYRAHADKFDGEFKQVVQGINDILDAVIEPVKEATLVLKEMEKGNLHVNVQGDFKGDHAVIKNALNSTINTMRTYINEISMGLTEMAQGNLNIEINADYRGDFDAIKTSIKSDHRFL
jgi:methyl-accepting chemotaxis protein